MTGLSVSSLSIVDWQFRAGIAFMVVVMLVASWLWLRRPLSRWTARAICVPLVVAFAAASVNAHYDYLPTLGALFGRNAADQVSAVGFQRLEFAHLQSARHRHGHEYVRPEPASTPVGLPDRGVVISFSMPATVSHFPARIGQVYLPPVWFQDPHPRLPVIELLHGSPGSPADWTRGGLADVTADAYARTHRGFAPILVMPDVNGATWSRDSECVNGPQGNAETYLTVDVRVAVVHAFGTRADAASWAVAGLSEGGSCALQMGLRHPDQFGVVGDFSGDDHPWVSGGLARLFRGTTPDQLLRAEQTYDPRALLAHWHAGNAPAIVFASGASDPVLAKMQRLVGQAWRDHIQVTLDVFPGGHTFWLWDESFARTLPWIMEHLWSPDPRLVSTRPGRGTRTAPRLHA